MMRSLFSGVSGLKNHQTRMDVIGNNISNVNTTGFKSSRVNFTDMLSQTLTGASTPSDNRGGTNPKQIGLGSAVGAIDLLFTNGSVQSTGKNTDLCISGNGLFQVKDGSGSTYYTRNGAFEFDALGNYVQPGNGLFVQGWMADEKGELYTTGETTNIIVPAGKSMESEETKTATYANNLNASPTGYNIANVTVTYSDGTTETTSNYNPTVSTSSSESGSITLTLKGLDGTNKVYTVDPSVVETYALGDTLGVENITITGPVSDGSIDLSLGSTDSNGNTISPTTKNQAQLPSDMTQYEISGTISNHNASDPSKLTFDVAGFTVTISPQPADLTPYANGQNYSSTVNISSVKAKGATTIGLSNGATAAYADGQVIPSDLIHHSIPDGDAVKLYTTTITSVTAKPTGAVTIDVSATDASGKQVYQSIEPTTIPNLTSGTYSVGGNYEVTQTITHAVADNANKTITLTLENTAGTGFDTVVIPLPDNSPTYKKGDSFTTTVPITKIEAKTGAEVALGDGTTEPLVEDTTISSSDQEYDKLVRGTIVGLKRNGPGTVVMFNDKDVSSVQVNTTSGTTLSALLGESYSADGTFYPSVVTTVTEYDSLGGSHDVPVLFTKVGENEWKLSLQGGVNTYSFVESDKTTTTVKLTSKNLTFNSNGAYTNGDATLLFEHENGSGDHIVNLNLSGLTQYIGSSTINSRSDGHAAGTLSSVSIDTAGVITGTYTNGVKRAEAQVAVAQFNNASGLTKTGESLYQESNNSGTANVKTAADLGVTITPSALEMSNVDVANEFTDMIVTQRGFQGNSKIITVSDEMLETLINMKR